MMLRGAPTHPSDTPSAVSVRDWCVKVKDEDRSEDVSEGEDEGEIRKGVQVRVSVWVG